MNTYRNPLLFCLALFLLICEGASAQITIYRDSTEFDSAFGRLRDIDFEDLYSVTLERILIRNPWGLHAFGVEDATQPDSSDTYLWIGQGATLDFPTRTRRIELEGYANPFRVRVTGFDGAIFESSFQDYPVTLSYAEGIRRIQLLGFDEYGNDDVNWRGGLTRILTYDDAGDTLADTDFEELQPDHYYLIGHAIPAFDYDPDPMFFGPIEWHGVTFTEPAIGFGGTYLTEAEGRVDPDSPIGNLSLELAPDATLDFPEGTEGVLLVFEAVHEQDSFLIEVTDYAGTVETILETGHGRQFDTNWVEDQRTTFVHLGVGSDAGIRQVKLIGANYFGSTILTAVHLAEMPQKEIAAIISEVSDLDTAGFIDDGRADMLRAKLAEAATNVVQSNRSSAVEQLRGFRDDVAGLAASDILVPEETKLFLDDAAYVIQRLTGVASVGNGGRMNSSGSLALDIPVISPGGMEIGYRAPAGKDPVIAVYDLRGLPVRMFQAEGTGEQMRTLQWDLLDAAGRAIPSGLYLITIQADGELVSRGVRVIR